MLNFLYIWKLYDSICTITKLKKEEGKKKSFKIIKLNIHTKNVGAWLPLYSSDSVHLKELFPPSFKSVNQFNLIKLLYLYRLCLMYHYFFSHFCSPCGKKFRSKPQLARFIGDAVDLSSFDFRTGKLQSSGVRRSKRVKNIHYDYNKGTRHDASLVLPIRQTASIFKQPVTLRTNHGANRIKADPKQDTKETPKQVGTLNLSFLMGALCALFLYPPYPFFPFLHLPHHPHGQTRVKGGTWLWWPSCRYEWRMSCCILVLFCCRAYQTIKFNICWLFCLYRLD